MAVTYKIKANPELFGKWVRIGKSIESLKSIVQNDMTITGKQLGEWVKLVDDTDEEFSCLLQDTLDYVDSCQV